jgi:cell division protein FtsB
VKILALILVGVLIALQYPLWFGKGGWLRVRDLQQQVDTQKSVTAKMEARNSAFDAEVRDLKSGYDALEERARYEQGMIRQDEMFFQFGPRGSVGAASGPAAVSASTSGGTAPATPAAATSTPAGTSAAAAPTQAPAAPAKSR